jgi:hypothetical protein
MARVHLASVLAFSGYIELPLSDQYNACRLEAMTKKISETQPVLDFIDITNQYCRLIEDRAHKNRIQLLQTAIVILPQLCLCAMRLPDIKSFPDYNSPCVEREQQSDTYTSLKIKFRDWNRYKEIFDVYNRQYDPAVYTTLSYDFIDIYCDIKPGLQGWDSAKSAKRLSIIWHWKFGFEIHWGEHATSAFRALYCLLFRNVIDKYRDHIGIRQKGVQHAFLEKHFQSELTEKATDIDCWGINLKYND